jgi:hypothetical protein
MTIGFLGPEGTYTDEAARQLFPNTTRMAYPSINAVFLCRLRASCRGQSQRRWIISFAMPAR